MKTAKSFAPQILAHGELSMKLVTAIIKPFKLDDVRAALSISACRYDGDGSEGFGRQRDTPSCIAAPSTWSTSFPRPASRSRCVAIWSTRSSRRHQAAKT